MRIQSIGFVEPVVRTTSIAAHRTAISVPEESPAQLSFLYKQVRSLREALGEIQNPLRSSRRVVTKGGISARPIRPVARTDANPQHVDDRSPTNDSLLTRWTTILETAEQQLSQLLSVNLLA